MDKRDQSKKDEIILRQLEVIRSMTEHNLSRMGADFWGTPTPEKHVPVAPLPEKEKRIPPADGGGEKGARGGRTETRKTPPKLPPKRTSRICRRSWTAMWASLR